VLGLTLIVGLLWFNKKQKKAKAGEYEAVMHQVQPMPELPEGARDGRTELGSDTYMHAELPANSKREIPELATEPNR